MLLLGCSLLGTFSSILVFIGLRKDQREFLVPYVLLMSLDIFIALLHFLHVVIFGNLKFEPLTGTLFTIDFFIFCLNVSTREKKKTFSRLTFEHDVSITILQMYCLICIVSQYQEYKNGQGLTTNHYIMVSRENQTRDPSILKKNLQDGIFHNFLSSPFFCNRQSNGVSHYKAPEKSCIVLHQSKTSPMNNGHTNFTLIQESQKNGSASKCFIISLD